jgi:3-phosphoshikimate 1-carboxyvinyltransferase
MLAALAQGTTRLSGLLDSDDTRVMLGALRQLGVTASAESVEGFGQKGPAAAKQESRVDIFVGNSGLSARSLVAMLAIAGGSYRIHGVPRMHERPIGDLVDALNSIGAAIGYEARAGFPPLLIRTGSVDTSRPLRVRGDVSSQFLTGLLMAAPLLAGNASATISVEGDLISKPYVEMTLAMMGKFGVKVARDGWKSFTIPAGSRYRSPDQFAVEADASSASYFLAAGAISGGPVRVAGVGRDSLQGDVRFAESLAQMGAVVRYGDGWIEAAAPASGRLLAIDADLNHIPDAAMTLAVCALFAEGTSRLRNIGSWRVKETDRLAAMANELRKTGAAVEEGSDFLHVTPPSRLMPPLAAIDTYDDHRIAMCFSLIAAGGIPVRINEPGCVAKTFPDYFERFRSLTGSRASSLGS